jgi:hypothetical protein
MAPTRQVRAELRVQSVGVRTRRPPVAGPLDGGGRREHAGDLQHRGALHDDHAGVGLDLDQVGLVLHAAPEERELAATVRVHPQEARPAVGEPAGDGQRLVVDRHQLDQVARGDQ